MLTRKMNARPVKLEYKRIFAFFLYLDLYKETDSMIL